MASSKLKINKSTMVKKTKIKTDHSINKLKCFIFITMICQTELKMFKNVFKSQLKKLNVTKVGKKTSKEMRGLKKDILTRGLPRLAKSILRCVAIIKSMFTLVNQILH